MSGLVALAGRRPVDRDLLVDLTGRLAARGPDGQGSRVLGTVGLGHALLATGGDRARDAEPIQPATLDGSHWIVADARVDGRARLEERRASAVGAGRGGPPSDGRDGGAHPATDAELILRAYRAWGVDLVRYLLGDFVFVLWDAPRRRLLCARDHLGIKPLYYAHRGDRLVVSNSLDCLRRHPDVDDEVDEAAIGDYLLSGFNRRPGTTALASVRRLPPAHLLVWGPGSGPRTRRYWRLPVQERPWSQRDGECVERFRGLLEAAVGDRLRGEPAAVLMSGGLDSTSVAATAVNLASPSTVDLRAITLAYEGRLEEPEAEHAERVAGFLGIPFHRVGLDTDARRLWPEGSPLAPEPVETGPTWRLMERLRQIAPGVRVGLTGQGGDPATHLSPADFWHQLAGRRALTTGVAVARWWWRRGRLPRVGLRTGLKRRLHGRDGRLATVYPPWLDAGLERRQDLRGRWRELDALPSGPDRALRPEAHADLTSSLWPALMERYDPGFTGVAAEMRHPWLDRRIVEFLLAAPPVPWCVEKELVRAAMRGRLPEAVRTRRKAPLRGFPAHLHLREGLEEVLRVVPRTRRLGRFIDVDRFLHMARNRSRLRPSEHYLLTRPLGLAAWLRALSRSRDPA